MEPKGHASSYIMDLMAFLQSIFMSFTNLPVRTAALHPLWVSGPCSVWSGFIPTFENLEKERGFSEGSFLPGKCKEKLEKSFVDLRKILGSR